MSANQHPSSSSKRSPLTEQDSGDGCTTISAASSSLSSSLAKSSARNDATTPVAATTQTQQQSKSRASSINSAEESRENRSLQLPASVDESEQTCDPVERPSTPPAEEVKTNANDSTPPSEQQQQQLLQQPDHANDSQVAAENETAATTTASTSTNNNNEEEQHQQQQQQEEGDEDEDLASSIELARMLMAEEAMASYQHSFQLLRDSADQLSQDDYNALQAAMMEDERDEAAEFLDEHGGGEAGNGNGQGGSDGDGDDEGDGNLSYETMLQLGERIGDVKAERWAMVAQSHISRLPTETYTKDTKTKSDSSEQQQQDDSEHKCLVCQHEYEDNDTLRRLVCGHCFHADCVDQWLARTDLCPYCRTSIVPTNED